ncbi:zinc ribbon domain-containing protein [Companilactobacillus zhongbaensis]|uniref:zinc ribbon domain-containing protein n=1 Tax=Companilactobacillus zhongbaensis TaxID=2486009 RepID=UPI0013DD8DE5|nr:zinc ribbon domain-containing protein [Companilactobacillus zhongbaensis]
MNNCTNCGAQLAQGMKFCTKCGQQVVTAETQNTATTMNMAMNNNQSIAALKKQSVNYFAWFKQSILDPTTGKDDNQYFGVISFLIHMLLISFGIFHVENGILTPLQQAIHGNSIAESFTNGIGLTFTTGLPLFFKLFALIAFFYIVYLGVGFFTKKYLADPQINFFNYTNVLARYSNVLVILEAIFAGLMIILLPANFTMSNINSVIMAMFFTLVIGGAAWSAAYVASIVLDQAKTKINKIYIAMIALISSQFVMWIVAKFMMDGLAHKYGDVIKTVLEQITELFG